CFGGSRGNPEENHLWGPQINGLSPCAGERSEPRAGSKLGQMLLRWMTDAEEGSDASDAEPPKSEADKPAPASASSSTGTAGYGAKELTDEERLQRVLQRCDAEGLERSEAQEALAAEQ
ncbi:unnamed protein product, partial [Effrenium voratum]